MRANFASAGFVRVLKVIVDTVVTVIVTLKTTAYKGRNTVTQKRRVKSDFASYRLHTVDCNLNKLTYDSLLIMAGRKAGQVVIK